MDSEHPRVTESGTPLVPPTRLDGDDNSPWKWAVTSYYGIRHSNLDEHGEVCSDTRHLDDRTKDAEVRSQAALPQVGQVVVKNLYDGETETVYSEKNN